MRELELLRAVERDVGGRLSQFLQELSELVAIESPTADPDAVDEAASWLGHRFDSLDAQVDWRAGEPFCAAVKGIGSGRILFVGHLDTVYPRGSVGKPPVRREGDRLVGPGVSDMKGGVLVGLYAIEALRARAPHAFSELRLLCSVDEEAGSPRSRTRVIDEARAADAVFVLESGRPGGGVVTARKGCARYVLRARGRSAHAGVEPEKGVNAIDLLVDALVRLRAPLPPGALLNVGRIEGGRLPNVVPDRAEAQVETRASDSATFDSLAARIAEAVTESGGRVVAEEFLRVPPWSTTPEGTALLAQAVALGESLRLPVWGTASGGFSDANWAATVNPAVLDGLGPVGGDDHSPREYLEIDSIPPRVALLCGLALRAAASVGEEKEGRAWP